MCNSEQCTLTLVMLSLPPLYPEFLGNKCARFESPPCCHISHSYIMGFDIEYNPPKSLNHTLSHTSRCHHCRYCYIGIREVRV